MTEAIALMTLKRRMQAVKAARVLTFLSRARIANASQIARGAGSVSREGLRKNLLPRLTRMGYIDIVGTESRARGGHPSPRYRITSSGVIFLIAAVYQFEDRLELNRSALRIQVKISFLVNRYGDTFPNLSPLWSRFRPRQIEDLACKRLEFLTSRMMLPEILSPKRLERREDFVRQFSPAGQIGSTPRQSEPSWFSKEIQNQFFDVTVQEPFNPKERRKWLNTIRDDPELRAVCVNLLEKRKRASECIARIMDFYIRHLTRASVLDDITAVRLGRDLAESITELYS
jgi:hypothetical protein